MSVGNLINAILYDGVHPVRQRQYVSDFELCYYHTHYHKQSQSNIIQENQQVKQIRGAAGEN